MPTVQAIRKGPLEHAAQCKWKVKEASKKLWISKPDKNGIFHWKILVPKRDVFADMAQTQEHPKPVKYDYKEFLALWKSLARAMRRIGVYCHVAKWARTGNFIDDAWDDATEWGVEQAIKDGRIVRSTKGKPMRRQMDNRSEFMKRCGTMLFTENRMYWAAVKTGVIDVQWDYPTKEMGEAATRILKETFGRAVTIPKSMHKTIQVKLKKV